MQRINRSRLIWIGLTVIIAMMLVSGCRNPDMAKPPDTTIVNTGGNQQTKKAPRSPGFPKQDYIKHRQTAVQRPSFQVQKILNQALVLYIDTPTAYVNGTKTQFDVNNPDICPVVKKDITIVPVRFISESLGAQVVWDNTAKRVIIRHDNKEIVLTIGSRKYSVNKVVHVLNIPVEIINGRTFIPMRVLVKALDRKVFYQHGLILIEDKQNTVNGSGEPNVLDELIFLCAGKGNTISNNISKGFFAKGGNWVYYRNPRENGNLYKMNDEGNIKVKLNADDVYFINIIGNWIYYLSRNNIYKIRPDGTGRIRISEREADWMTVIGNWIYYVDTNRRLSKMMVDGTNYKQLSDDTIGGNWSGFYFVAIEGDWIYYHRGSLSYPIPGEPQAFFRIKTDGTEKTRLGGGNIGNFTISEEWIYYSDFDGGLFKMRLDGSNIVPVQPTNCRPDFINIVGDWIYYREADDYRASLYKMKIDGSQKTKLNDDDSWYASIVGDWIYYERDHLEDGICPLYRIRFDGSQRTKIT